MLNWITRFLRGRFSNGSKTSKRREGHRGLSVEKLEDRYMLSGVSLIESTFFGGGGDQRGTDVDIQGSDIFVSVNENETGTASANSFLVKYASPTNASTTPVFSKSWNFGTLNGLGVDGTNVYGAGFSHPSAGLTSDGSGGAEVKTLLTNFDANNVAGGGPGGSNWAAIVPATFSPTSGTSFYQYDGSETHNDALAVDDGGNKFIYTIGSAQPCSHTTFVVGKYDSAGNLVTAATSAASDFVLGCTSPNEFKGNVFGIVEIGGQIYVAGNNHDASDISHPTVWKFDGNLANQWKHRDAAIVGDFVGLGTDGTSLYAVGQTRGANTDYVIAKYDQSGNQLWRTTSDGGGTADNLRDVVVVGGRLFAVGYTNAPGAGGEDMVILEIDPTTGTILSTDTFGGAQNDRANRVATDGTDLYVIGETRSFAEGGNTIGQNDAVLLRYSTNDSLPAVKHEGNLDPVNDEGWTAEQGPVAVANGPITNDQGSGFDAWFVNDGGSTTYLDYAMPVSPVQASNAFALGWTLRTRLRVVDPSDGVDGGIIVGFHGSSERYFMRFGSQADGDPIVQLDVGGPTYALEGTGGGYHLYELVYDPIAGSADLFVDGIEQISNFVGLSPATPSVVWGSGSSVDFGHANYNLIELAVHVPNQEPNFTAANPPAVNEDAGAQTVSGWATFDPGAANESGQTATYTVSNVGNPSLFAVAPSVDTSGNLTYTPATNANGTSIFDVQVQDNGGTANGGDNTSQTQTFTITVNAVNDAPDVVLPVTDPTPVQDGSEFIVNSTTPGNQGGSRMALLAGGGYVVAWNDFSGNDGNGQGVFARVYDATGSPVGSDFQVNTVVTSGEQGGPVPAALTGGGFVITWNQNDGSSFGIYARIYDAAGNPVGSEFRANTTTSNNQSGAVSTGLPGGGFVTSWVSFGQDGSGTGVFAQRFDANGTKVGPEFLVNSFTSGNQGTGGLWTTSLNNGDFVISWDSFQDGSDRGVYAQRYDSSGNPLGSEFQVNTTTAGEQSTPAVEGLDDGGFVIVFNNSDGNALGISGQRYDASGNTVGSEFQVNSTTTGHQGNPRASRLADGGFVSIWTSIGQDGSGAGVFGQRFDNTGAPVGSEFQLNTTTSGDQQHGQLFQLQDGSAVAAWWGQDNDQGGIVGQRFDIPDSSLITNEDAPLTISGVMVSDIDAGTDPIAMSLSVNNGELSLTNTTGLTFTDSDGTDGTLAFTGSQTDITAAFANSIVYTPDQDFNGIDTLTISANDQGSTGSGGAMQDTEQLVITVNAVNDEPSFTAANPPAVNEDAGAQTVNGWATFDPGAANESGQTATYVLSNVSNPGLFSAGPTVDANGNLTYTPAANANGSATFDVQVQDNGGTANGGDDTSQTQTFTLSVNAVNDAPEITSLSVSQAMIFENDSATLNGSFTDPDVGDEHTVTIDWGDGTVQVETLTIDDRSFSFGHQYLDDGDSPGNGTPQDDYTISVTVSDDAGANSDTPPVGVAGWWQAEGNADDSAGTNNGTLLNGATFGAGNVGQAFQLDGVDDYVEAGTDASLDFSTAMTIEAWINPATTQTSPDSAIAGKVGANGGANEGYMLVFVGNTVDVYANTQTMYLDSNTTIPSNTWTHVAATWDGNLWQLYINGVLDPVSVAYTTPPNSVGQEFRIGRYSIPNRNFAGLIDEVSVYDRALDSQEITDIVSAGSAGKTASETVTVTVKNVAPELDNFAVTSMINENGTATLSGDVVDPGTLDTFTLDVDWGDPLSPSNSQSFALGNTTLTKAADGIDWNPVTRVFSVDHQYLDDNPTATSQDDYTISVTLSDDDGGSDSLESQWSIVASLSQTRSAHTSTLLADGRLLVAGGGSIAASQTTSELYDPSTGTWTQTTGLLNKPRGQASAVRLQDGRVLVTGGRNGNNADQFTAEIYDPATDQWTLTGNMISSRVLHSLTLLNDGRVLAVGGYSDNGGGFLNTAETYNPATGVWTSVPSLSTGGRWQHSATLLQDGRVLVVGGENYSAPNDAWNTAEIFNPTTNLWTTVASMSTRRSAAGTVLLNDGTVLVAGGFQNADPGNSSHTSVELYDPLSNTWTPKANLNQTRFDSSHATTVLLNDGRVVFSGGFDIPPTPTATVEVYDPTSDTWTLIDSLGQGRTSHTMTVLGNGSVITVGGYDGTNSISAVETLVAGEIVTVKNVAPVFDAGPNLSLPAGSGSFNRTGIAFTDPGTLDVHTVKVDYNGDAIIDQTINVPLGIRTFDLSHTYVTSGVHTVSVTLEDDDFGSLTDTLDVTVSLELDISIDGSGNLVISDASGTDNDLTIQSDTAGNQFVITDSSGAVATVPFASVSGSQIIVDSLAGDDSLTVDFSLGNFSKIISYDGGANSGTGDSLSLTGGTFASATYNYATETEGSIDVPGNQPINYINTEPISSTITAATVTLNYGNSAETITITDAGGGQTTVDSTVGEITTFNNPTTSLVIYAGGGADVIDVASLSASYPASVSIDGQGDADTINVNGAIGVASGNNISADADTINVNADLTTSGSGIIALTADRNIYSNMANITTVDGTITMDANNAGASAGNFVGIELRTTNVSSANGNIQITGRGGNFNNFNKGVLIGSGSTIQSAGTGASAATISIDGTGGSGASNNNVGIDLIGSISITSIDGNILLTGTGGNSFGSSNVGVLIDSGPLIESTGTGLDAATITINGTGGNANSSNHGIIIQGTSTPRIASKDGDIQLTGIGGTSSGSDNMGVFLGRATIESTGTGANAAHITIDGTGGTSTNANRGVFVTGTNTSVTSVDGDIQLVGQGTGTGTDNDGVRIDFFGSVSTTGGNLTLDGTSSAVGTGRGVLVTTSASVQSHGGTIDVTGTGSGVDASIEVTGINAGTGAASLTAPTGVIREAEAGTDVVASTVTINGEVAPGGSPGQTVFDGNVTFSALDALSVELDGLAAGTGYDQLQVVGPTRVVDLGGASLTVTPGFTPSPGDAFTIIDNVDPASTLTGTFVGLADGATITAGGSIFHIYYSSGINNNDVILIANRPPTAPVDNDAATNEVDEGATTGTPVGVAAFATDPDGDNVTYTLTNDAGGRFDVGLTTGIVTVGNGNLLDGPDSHVITVQASDGLGGTTTSNFTINVNNVAPTVSLDSVAMINENGIATLTGNIVDPATLDTFTLNVDWGDPLSPGNAQSFALGTSPLTKAIDGIDWNPVTGAFSVDHQYLDDNPTATSQDDYTIDVSVSDDDSVATVGTWSTLASMTTGAVGSGAFVGDVFYVAGLAAVNTPVFASYDTATDTWSTLSPSPTLPLRATTSIEGVGGKLYVIGGCINFDCNVDSNAVEIYDPLTANWTTAAAMPTTRGQTASAVIGDKIYVAGGSLGSLQVSKKLEIYDTTTNTWSTGADMSTGREALQAVALDGKFYVFGGFERDAVNAFVGTLDIYDPVTNSWSSGTPMPTPASSTAVGTIGGKIYVAGGNNSSGTLSIVQVYDPTTDTWSTDANMLAPRQQAASGVHNGTLYVATGFTPPSVSNALETFTPAGPATAQATVTVKNIAAQLANVTVTPMIDENSVATLSGDIVDPGTLDTFTLDLDWGDPLSPGNTQSFALGTTALTKAVDGIDWNPFTGAFSIDHQYLDDNPTATSQDDYTIQVTVVDDDTTAAVTSGRVGYWPADGNANDLSGSGNHGTLNGGATFDAGVVGQAFSLDGSNDWISTNQTFANDQSHTISSWVYWDGNNGQAWQEVVSWWDTSITGPTNRMFLGTVNQALVPSQGPMRYGDDWLNVPYALPTGQWVHLAATYDGATNNREFFVNGTSIATLPGSDEAHFATLAIGRQGNLTTAGEYWDGKIDELALYDRVLNGTEIQTLASMTGAGDTDSVNVTVKNVAPELDNIAVTPMIDENGIATLNGHVVDPGTLDTFTLDVNWGDPLSPSNSQSFALGNTTLTKVADGIDWNPATRVFSVDHQYLDDNPTTTSQDNYTVGVTVTDDDGGIGMAATGPSGLELDFALSLGSTGSTWEFTNDVITDSAGNIYVAGSFTATIDFDPGPGTFNLTGAGLAEPFVAKYTSNGDLIWAKEFNSSGHIHPNSANSLALDSLGNLYVGGAFHGTMDSDPGPGVVNLNTSSSLGAGFLLKLDNAGDFVWSHQLTLHSPIQSVVVDAADNLYYSFSAHRSAVIDVDPGPGVFNVTAPPGTGPARGFIVKVNSGGTLDWVNGIGGFGQGAIHNPYLAVDGSGNVFAASSYDSTVDFDAGGGTTNLVSNGGSDVGVWKLNSSGNLIWAKSLGGTSNDNGFHIALDSSNNVYTVGKFEGTADFDPGPTVANLSSAGSGDAFAAKLDSNGNFVWAKSFGGTSYDALKGVTVDQAGQLFATGIFQQTVDFDPGAGVFNLTSGGGGDIAVWQLDSNGDFLDAVSAGGAGSDEANKIAVDVNGDVLVGGWFNGLVDFDPTVGTSNLTSNGGNDGLLWKLTATSASPTVLVKNVNPVAADQDYTMDEDDLLNINVLAGTDDSGPFTVTDQGTLDTHTAVAGTFPTTQGGSVTIATNGAATYDPADDFFGTDTFDFTAVDDDSGSDTGTVTVTVNAVNDEPSFTASNPAAVNEDTGAQTVNGWVTAFDPGPANESGQSVLVYAVSNLSNAGLFAVAPSVDSSGNLSYTPAVNANGTSTFDVQVQDDGGTANGGDDISQTQTFMITVNAVNDEPSFVAGANQNVLEDSGPHSVVGWATAISPGPADESGQTLSFIVDSNTDSGLFAAGPAINAAGDLTYTLAADAKGSSTIGIKLMDNGGTANGGDDESPVQFFDINVTAVNDEPTFVAASPATVNEDAGAQSVNGWALFDPGAANESGQTVVGYTVSNVSNPGLFSAAPAVDAAGNLTYTSALDAFGSSTFDVVVQDSGGTTNGGDDTSQTQTFTITVNAVNDEPTFSASNPAVVDQDLGPQTVASWATFDSGAANESQSVLAYTISNVSNPTLFSAGPSVDVSGNLTYTSAPGAFGTSTFDVQVQDNGGTANGGDDTSQPQPFTITIIQTNTPPTTTGITDVEVGEDAPDTVINLFAAFDDAEDIDADLTFTVTNNTNPALFTSTTINGVAGTLTLNYAPDTTGTADITVRATDTGTLFVETTFTVTVLSAQDQLDNLIDDVIDDLVNNGPLNNGQGNALTSKLQNAIDKLNPPNPNINAAINKLNAFINQLQGWVPSKLTQAEAQPFIDAANAAIASALPGSPLMATSVGGQSGGPIGSHAITSTASHAMDFWRNEGATTSQLDLLRATPIYVAQLPGHYLGAASPTAGIWLDRDAAGHGWYVGAGGVSEVGSQVDLLSVLKHEMGHVIGHEHVDHGVMVGHIDAGTSLLGHSSPVIATTSYHLRLESPLVWERRDEDPSPLPRDEYLDLATYQAIAESGNLDLLQTLTDQIGSQMRKAHTEYGQSSLLDYRFNEWSGLGEELSLDDAD